MNYLISVINNSGKKFPLTLFFFPFLIFLDTGNNKSR